MDDRIEQFVTKYRLWLLGCILLFALFLRLRYLGFDSMWIDETISAVAALGIIEHGYPLLESGAIYGRAQLYHYLMAGSILLFGGDFGARFIAVIFGVLTVYLAYLYGRRFIGRPYAGLVFALFMALSALAIVYSQQARFYQAFMFFYFLTFYLFYKFLIAKEQYWTYRWLDFVSLGLSLYMTIHLQVMGWILVPLLAAVYVLYNLRMRYLGVGLLLAAGFLWYLLSRLRVNVENVDQVMLYGSQYTQSLFGYVPFIILCVAGAIFALFTDWKKHASILLVAVVPFIGLFFLQEFATRYMYFMFFIILFYAAYVFSTVRLPVILLAIFLVLFTGTVFTFTGIMAPNLDPTAPVADFRGAYEYDFDAPVVVTWAPAAVWYGDGADYWIRYSVSGRSSETWTTYNGVERFSGATIIENVSELPDSYYVVLDAQAARKIAPAYLMIFQACANVYSGFNIDVLRCGD